MTAEIQENLAVILPMLRSRGVTATFFVLGRIARDSPEIVASIAAEGHEIACHGMFHRRLKDPASFRAELREASSILRDTSGQAVVGFRAPEFSITRRTEWALDVLRDEGYEYDSSIVPTSLHDVYGIGGADARVHRLENGLCEIPLSVIRFLGLGLPVAGGGYFRLYPLWVTMAAIRRFNRAGRPAIMYVHPYEIGPRCARIPMNPARRFRHYVNMDRGRERLLRLLDAFRFTTLREVARSC